MSISIKLENELRVWEDAISKASDSIYGILISHLYLEHLLDRYLNAELSKDVGLLDKKRLTFASKLKRVKSFGEIDVQLLDSISKVNDIRNNCAHVFGHEISDEEVEKLGRTLGKNYKSILQKYPDTDTHGIAPITWHICGHLLSYVALVEGWE